MFRAENAAAAERAIHIILQDQQQEGEWFRLTKDQEVILSHITDCREGKFWIEGQPISLEEKMRP